MAKCEEGYRCHVCGHDVDDIGASDLYLRYVVGWLDPEVLHTERERHIRCNPALAQFVVDPAFEPMVVEGEFDKRRLAADLVRERERLISAGWRRLQEIRGQELSVLEYPLPEVRAAMRAKFGKE